MNEYEWLCGEPPFDGSPIEVAMQHLHDSPQPLRDKIPDLAPAVEQVVQPVGYSETHRPVRRIKIEIQVKRETTNSFDKFACLDGGAGCHHGSLFFIPFLFWAEHQ